MKAGNCAYIRFISGSYVYEKEIELDHAFTNFKEENWDKDPIIGETDVVPTELLINFGEGVKNEWSERYTKGQANSKIFVDVHDRQSDL